MAALRRRAGRLRSNLGASRMPWRSLWNLPAGVTVRLRLKLIAPSVTKAMEHMNAACVSVTRGDLAHAVNALMGITVHPMTLTAAQSQRVLSAMGEGTACVESAPAIEMTLEKSGASTANVTISTAYVSKGNCVQVSERIKCMHLEV